MKNTTSAATGTMTIHVTVSDEDGERAETKVTITDLADIDGLLSLLAIADRSNGYVKRAKVEYIEDTTGVLPSGTTKEPGQEKPVVG